MISWQLSQVFFVYAAGYILLNIVYNFRAKRIVIVDVLIVAFGFSIRILAGAAATHIAITLALDVCFCSGFIPWVYQTTI